MFHTLHIVVWLEPSTFTVHVFLGFIWLSAYLLKVDYKLLCHSNVQWDFLPFYSSLSLCYCRRLMVGLDDYYCAILLLLLFYRQFDYDSPDGVLNANAFYPSSDAIARKISALSAYDIIHPERRAFFLPCNTEIRRFFPPVGRYPLDFHLSILTSCKTLSLMLRLRHR